MLELKIKVTQKDIDECDPKDDQNCMVGRALTRALKAITNITVDRVDTKTCQINDQEYILPVKVARFIAAYYIDVTLKPNPFTFKLKIEAP